MADSMAGKDKYKMNLQHLFCQTAMKCSKNNGRHVKKTPECVFMCFHWPNLGRFEQQSKPSNDFNLLNKMGTYKP